MASGLNQKIMKDSYDHVDASQKELAGAMERCSSKIRVMYEEIWYGGNAAEKWYAAVYKNIEKQEKYYFKVSKAQKIYKKNILELYKKSMKTTNGCKLSNKAPSLLRISKIQKRTDANSSIFVDSDRVLEQIKTIKTELNNINEALAGIENGYKLFSDNPKTTGRIKKTFNSLVNGSKKYKNNNKNISRSLDSSLSKSIVEYLKAVKGSDKVDSLAEKLGTVK